MEHYSRFADGIPVRLHYAVAPSGSVLNVEQLVPPPGSEKRGRELAKVDSTNANNNTTTAGEAWALRTIPNNTSNMGAPLAMPETKGGGMRGQGGKQVLISPNTLSPCSLGETAALLCSDDDDLS